MRVYMDVSCLNRPFDDQRQDRIHLESEAVALIFQRSDGGEWAHVSSRMAEIEIEAMVDDERRRRVLALLPEPRNRVALTAGVVRRAANLIELGFKPADATHLAAAEAARADVMLTCDDRLLRRARRVRRQLKVRVDNPVVWLREQNDALDA